MPGLPVIPEVDQRGYDSYARQLAKRRRMHNAGNAWVTSNGSRYNARSVPRRAVKPDYFGLDNSMKKLSINKPRKWRTADDDDDKNHRLAWQSTTNKDKNRNENEDEKQGDEEDRRSVACVDRNVLRRNRSSRYAKYKYPEKFHHGFRSEHSQLEENIPQCLRKYPCYGNQPVRQDCAYNPIRSVTQLNVHSIKSQGLPHPNPNGTITKRRRPTSAPPRTMTSHAGSANSSFHKSNSFMRTNSARSGSSAGGRQRPQTAIGHRGQELMREDLERNGSFEYSYEEEGPTHVTLEVLDSDDEQNTISGFNDDPRDRSSARDPLSFRSSIDSNCDSFMGRGMADAQRPEPEGTPRNDDDESHQETTKGKVVSDAEEVASDSAHSEDHNDYVYSDRESESAKSVDSEPYF